MHKRLMMSMKILALTEGTVLMHKRWIGLPREQVVGQVKSWSNLSEEELQNLRKNGAVPGPTYFAGSFPIGNAVKKIEAWQSQGQPSCT
jgi:hypothetical protein